MFRTTVADELIPYPPRALAKGILPKRSARRSDAA